MLKRLRTGSLGNVTTMMTGNISAQAIAFFFFPIISRLFLPEDFGAMALVWALVGLLGIIATLRYEQAIVIEHDEYLGINILFICLASIILLSVFISLCLFIFGDYIEVIFDMKQDNLLWFVPIGIIVNGIYLSYTYVYTRRKRFKSLAGYRASTTLISQVSKVSIGFLAGSSAIALLIGNTAGIALASILMSVEIIRYYGLKKLKTIINLSDMRKMVLKYKIFPIYQIPNDLINQLSQRAVILAFAFFYSTEVVGFFGFMTTIARQPVQLVHQSLSKVYLQSLVELKNKGLSLRDTFLKTTAALALVGFIPFLILGGWGRPLFAYVFGDNWSTAGLYAQYMAPWFFLLFVNPPATQLFVVLQKLRFTFIYNIFNSGIRISLILFMCLLGRSPEEVLVMISGLGVLFNIFYMSIAYKEALRE